MERDCSSLLPDYEEAVLQGQKQTPPPPYSVAMSANGHVVLDGESASVSTAQQQPDASIPATDATASSATSPPPYDGGLVVPSEGHSRTAVNN